MIVEIFEVFFEKEKDNFQAVSNNFWTYLALKIN